MQRILMNQNKKKSDLHLFSWNQLVFFIGYNHKKYFLHYYENNKLRNKFVDRHIHVLHISQSAILSIYN